MAFQIELLDPAKFETNKNAYGDYGHYKTDHCKDAHFLPPLRR